MFHEEHQVPLLHPGGFGFICVSERVQMFVSFFCACLPGMGDLDCFLDFVLFLTTYSYVFFVQMGLL